MKAKVNPAIKIALAAAVLMVGGWWVLRRFQIEVGTISPDSIPIIKTDPDRTSEPQPSGTPRKIPSTPSSTDKPDDPARATARQGSLRVSNRSSHPLRVALLSRQSQTTPARSDETIPAGVGTPVHWDFSPSEGSEKGLLVSLPDRTVTLKKGDIVVAFAQDGSQRYWGPYIVGESAQPAWNSQLAEWELALDR